MNTTTTPSDQRVRRGKEVASHPEVSVILLVLNDTRPLRRALDSILAHRPEVPVTEIVILANGTPSEELTWLEARQDIVLLVSSVNLGFGDGCNWAALEARGSRLLFMNDDALATPAWLDELRRALDEDDQIGVVGSRVLLTNGTLQEAGGVVWSDGTTSGIGRGMDPSAPQYATRRDVDYVSFCSTMVARDAWDAVGGFDDRYFPAYYEDADFCLTARSLGWRVVCEPRSVVVHAEGASTSPRFKRFLTRRNREVFVDKWGAALADAEPPPSLTTGQAAVRRALNRSASRTRALGRAPRLDPAPGHAAPSSDAHAGPFTAYAVTAQELASLRRMATVTDAFIQELVRELDTDGMMKMAHSHYRAWRARAGRLLTRHPRLSHWARSVIVSVGNRD